MKARYLLYAMLVLPACAGKTEIPGLEWKQMTITAYQEGSDITRTTVLNGGTQVYWEPSDEIKVFFNGVGGRFIAQNTENATVATFTGALPLVVGANEGAGVSTKTLGLYPYRSDAVQDGETIITTLPASQTGRAGSFAKNTNISIAQSEGYGLAFYNVCGGLRFTLSQEGIKRVTFEGNNGEAIAGKIKVAFADGIPVVQEVSDGESVITLTAPGGGSFHTGQWYYISAIPGKLSGGFKMVFYKESESAKFTSFSSVTFKRGIFGTLADADEDLVFKPTGGGDEPNPDDVIQFADPVAKYACVEKFDTNGDGELSYVEAAAVTSLSGLFTDWNTVKSFEEIRYFTGVSSTVGVFAGLSNLEGLTVPNFITTLGTFEGCSSLKSVTLPSGLTSLPASCFSGCSALTSVDLPDGITSIPIRGFFLCSSLTSLELSSGIKSIGKQAFCGCTSLASIAFPSTLSTIDDSAFSSCSALTSVNVSSPISIGAGAFGDCTALTLANLSGALSVGRYAFEGCNALKTVVLPEGLTAIEYACFKGCSALASISWPSTISIINDYAFYDCRFEENGCVFELPASITTIGSSAFGHVRHLVIPSSSIVSISADSFSQNYTYLYVPSDLVEIYKVRSNWSQYSEWIHPISDYPYCPASTVEGTVGVAVDLGLSVKWASWNIGASKPEECGDYFAWGETEPKYEKGFAQSSVPVWKPGNDDGYSWENYYWCNGTYKSLTMYNTNSKYGRVDNNLVLDLPDDAAHVHWGEGWRMPTMDEWYELIDNCTIAETTENGVYGLRVTSLKEGFTNKSIFLPSTGTWYGTDFYNYDNNVCYWSSSLATGEYDDSYGPYEAYIFTKNTCWGSSRCYGYTIRPVYDVK